MREQDKKRLDAFIEQAKYLLLRLAKEEVLAVCDMLITLRPDDLDVYYEKADALYGLERNQEAFDVCDIILEKVPKDAQAYFWKGVNLWLLVGNQKEALQMLNTEELSDDVSASKLKELLLTYPVCYKEVAAFSPPRADAAYYARQACYYLFGALRIHELSALRVAEKAIDCDPDYIEPYILAGAALTIQGRFDEAQQYLRFARDMAIDLPTTCAGKSDLLLEIEEEFDVLREMKREAKWQDLDDSPEPG